VKLGGISFAGRKGMVGLRMARLRLGLEYLGGITLLTGRAARALLTPPWEWNLILYQMNVLGVQSLSIVLIASTFIGMVLAIQGAYALEAFGAKLYVGEAVTISMVRELAPVLISLMVGGRVGAGITAEIGSMNVTEQIDAMRAMGADPVRKLVVPRFIAFFFMLPTLVLIADAMGVIGGWIISYFQLRIAGRFYVIHAFRLLTFHDIFSGLGKTFVFAAFIVLIGCFNGMKTEGGADGVGRSTTGTVVVSSIVILISNFFLTKLFLVF
jgi:phospholipid/cholesterol/gamma-HCH transport system permease protein